MKVSALLFVTAIAAAVGYLFGTESGRQQKGVLLEKVGRKSDDLGIDEVRDAVQDVGDNVAQEVNV